MEKLQKALQKAREQRGTGPEPALQPRHDVSALQPSDGMTSVDAAWAELPMQAPDRKLLDQNLVVSLDAHQKAAAFDILRTKVQILMEKKGWSRLAITSPTPDCGKTTMACNLALGFARQADLRTILIELDLRRPSIARMLGTRPPHDVTSMLRSEVSFAEQAFRIGNNVAVSAARSASKDPTAILLNPQTSVALEAIESVYAPDLVIFDMPPVLVTDDTRAFLKNVDCAMLVAKAEVSTVSQIDNSEREIGEQTNVLGVVLNQYRYSGDSDAAYASYYTG